MGARLGDQTAMTRNGDDKASGQARGRDASDMPPPPDVPPMRGAAGIPISGSGLGILPRSPSEQIEPGRGPEPPRGRRSRRVAGPSRTSGLVNVMNGALTGGLLLLLAAVAAYQFALSQFDRPGPAGQQVEVAIPKGDGLNAIADRLVREGVLSDRWLFTLGVFRFQAQRKLKAGEYQFPAQASVREVLDILVEGKTVQHKVTIPEGRTSFEVVEILNRQPLLTGEIQAIPPEGSLLPNTYIFARGTSRLEILRRMERAQAELLDDLWANRAPNLPISTPQEAINLAAIVEKETGVKAERARVAGVFINRLNRGMRLQSDPTIIYGITLGRGPLDRPIRRSDINRKDEFNTYQIAGLPKTPICNPGKAAIAAVLNPDDHDELFFVADGTGGHRFARTLDEHNANVRNWRKIERALRERQAAARAAEARGDASGGVRAAAAAGANSLALATQATGSELAASTQGFPLPGRNPRK